MVKAQKKLAIIGLDSVGPYYVSKILKHFNVSYFRWLIYKYGFRKIECFPPNSPASWNSIFTGYPAHDHGILDFYYIDYVRNRWQYTFAYQNYSLKPRIWETVPRDKITVVIGAPTSLITHTTSNNIIIMADWLAPKDVCINCDKYNISPLFFSALRHQGMAFIDKIIDELTLLHEKVLKIINVLQPHILIVVIPHTDWIGHKILRKLKLNKKYFNQVNKVFCIIDNIIRSIVEQYDNIIIVSDHDMINPYMAINILGILFKHNMLKANGIVTASKVFISESVPELFHRVAILLNEELNNTLVNKILSKSKNVAVPGRYWYLRPENNVIIPTAYPYMLFCRDINTCTIMKVLLEYEGVTKIVDIRLKNFTSFPLIELRPKRADSFILTKDIFSARSIINNPPIMDHGLFGIVISNINTKIGRYICTNYDVGKILQKLIPVDKKIYLRYILRSQKSYINYLKRNVRDT